MIMKRFNAAGVTQVRNFLQACREQPDLTVPKQLLVDAALTSDVKPGVDVQDRRFATRRDAAIYLRTILEPIPEAQLRLDEGLWTWLSLYYFEDVCPTKNGRRSVKNDYTYIFRPDGPRYFYRHLLFLAWRVAVLTPIHNRLFLDVPFASVDKATSEVVKRLFLTRIPCIFETIDRIYWDDARGRIRAGVVNTRRVVPGNLMHRLPLRIRQLEMTYDLQSLNADQLIDLLGDEFAFERQRNRS